MFSNSRSAFLSRLGARSVPLLVVVFCLLTGCATPPPLSNITGSDDQTETVTSPKAGYNKPYKVRGKTYSPMLNASGYKATGLASWYGSESGSRTASGLRFDPNGLTAAHKTLPIPSKVRVTNLKNGRYVDVIVNDRGPFRHDRLIDLSHGAAKEIGMRGVTEVAIEYLGS